MLSGVFTALVTPFSSDYKIDYDALDKLIAKQVATKVSGLVLFGSTGEGHSITHQERLNVLSFVKERYRSLKIIVSVSRNVTSEAVDEVLLYNSVGGIDAIMVTVPFYNKPTPDGIKAHFIEVANISSIPILIYNVPSRTGVNIDIQTILELAKHKNIFGIKNATLDVLYVTALLQKCPSGFDIFAGDDMFSPYFMIMGGVGVISVISNIYPNDAADMINAFLSHDFKTAMSLYAKLWKYMELLNIDTNPLPIKTALSSIGLIEEVFRLPLCQMCDTKKQIIIKEFTNAKNS